MNRCIAERLNYDLFLIGVVAKDDAFDEKRRLAIVNDIYIKVTEQVTSGRRVVGGIKLDPGNFSSVFEKEKEIDDGKDRGKDAGQLANVVNGEKGRHIVPGEDGFEEIKEYGCHQVRSFVDILRGLLWKVLPF